jgi:nucleoside-diphosphate-sugar epimerase
MSRALIGYTGFVGSNLLNQQSFSDNFNSRNIESINGRHFESVVCAGVSAAKWIANCEPVKDAENIEHLKRQLKTITTDKFILISTVDVYPRPIDVDENSSIRLSECQPYGKHRLELEQFIAAEFDALIVRLPGLFGEGLKKNIIFDFLNNNNIEKINPENIFQFYDLKYLTKDIQIGIDHNLNLLNISTEPTSVGEIAKICLGHEFKNKVDGELVKYDYRSCHANKFGGKGGYLYNKEQVLTDLKQFVASESEN